MVDPGKSNELQPMRFQREAEIAARLHHTNIIPVYESGHSDGLRYYAMQFIDGANLQSLIADDKRQESLSTDVPAQTEAIQSESEPIHESPTTHRDPDRRIPLELSPHHCAEIALQVAEGLDFAHQRGVLHRDIKPSNIIIDREQRAWIADFGLAKSLEDRELTVTGDVVGTVRFLAPERFQGRSDHRSDIYALGLTLYEMLEKRPAWHKMDRAQLVQQIVNGKGLRFDNSSTAPQDLIKIVEKATSHDPSSRYQHAREMADDLRRFLDGRPVLARKQSVVRNLWSWTKRNPLPAAFAASTFLALAFGVVASLVLATYWRNASQREHAFGKAAEESAKQAQMETERSKNLLKLTTGALSEMTSIVVTDAMTSQKSLTDQQSKFLGRVLRYNRELLEVSGSDAEARVRNANALRSTAGIHSLLGDKDQALKDIGESVTKVRELVSEYPEQSEYLFELSEVLIEQGRMLASNRNFSQALRCFIEGRDATIQYLKDNNDVAAQQNLGVFENNIGNISQEFDRYPEAIEAYEKATVIQKAILKSNPERTKLRVDLGRTYHNLSLTLTKNKEVARAKETCDLALQLRKGLWEQFPANHEYYDDYAGSLNSAGRIALAMNQPEEAIKRFEESKSIYQSLVNDYPLIPTYKSKWAGCFDKLGSVYESMNRGEEALQLRFEAIRIMQSVVDAKPNMSNRFTLACMQYDLARKLEDSQFDEAWKLAVSAIANCRQLIEQAPTSKEYRESLVNNLNLQGRILRTKKRATAAALAVYEESAQVLDQLERDFPNDPTSKVGTALSWVELGLVLIELGRESDALIWLDRSIAYLASIQASDPRYKDSRQTFARAYTGRGDAKANMLNHVEAVLDRQQAVALTTDPKKRDQLTLNLALSLARTEQTVLALDLANKLTARPLSTVQRRYLARVFVSVAALVQEDQIRKSLLESARTQLEIAYAADPAAVMKLISDKDFKAFWSEVTPE